MESRKVFLYICGMTKSLKITDWVHRELKMYSVKEGKTVTENADQAILMLLQMKGHKINLPKVHKKRTS